MQSKGLSLFLALALAASCAAASPCDRVALQVAPSQKASLFSAVTGQMQPPSGKVLHSYRLGNWYLFNVDTRVADEAYVFFRGDPLTHRYAALWEGGHASSQAELRNWARLNAPGIPESLAKCFAYAAGRSK